MPQKVPSLPTMYCDCCLHISSAISIRTAPAAHKKRAPHTHTAPVFPKTLPERIPIKDKNKKSPPPKRENSKKDAKNIPAAKKEAHQRNIYFRFIR